MLVAVTVTLAIVAALGVRALLDEPEAHHEPTEVGAAIDELDALDARIKALDAEIAAGEAELAALREAPPRPRTPDLPAELPQVRCAAPGRCTVARAEFDRLRGDTALFERRMLRVMPSVKDGARVGYKVYSVKPELPSGAVGLKNGDLVLRINDHDVTTADGADAARDALFTADELRVDIERKGAPLRLVLRVE